MPGRLRRFWEVAQRHRLILLVSATTLVCSPCRAQGPAVVSAPPVDTCGPTNGVSEGELASIIGSVADEAGALIPAAHISLKNKEGRAEESATSDGEGHFHFSNLRPCRYSLVVSSPGFAESTSLALVLHPGEVRDLQEVKLIIPANHADVFVTVSRRELAEEEIHTAEHQRVLGIFPNFYTSFTPDPVPLDTRQKFSLALHATADPVAFATAGLVAGGEQLRGTFAGYGSGPAAFGKRYGAAYADAFVGKMIGAALLPSIFRQDPRYFYLGTGSGKARVRHALLSAVLARHDTGRWEPNYSHILGNAAAGAISTAYHPRDNSAGKLALDNALIGIGGSAAVNLVREFVLKPFTHGVPKSPPPSP